jgi:hypothetical protein
MNKDNIKSWMDKQVKLTYCGKILRSYRIFNLYKIKEHIFFSALSYDNILNQEQIFYPLSVINKNSEMKLSKEWFYCSKSMCKYCYLQQYFLLKGDNVDIVLTQENVKLICFGNYQYNCIVENNVFSPQLFCFNQHTQDDLFEMNKNSKVF